MVGVIGSTFLASEGEKRMVEAGICLKIGMFENSGSRPVIGMLL